MSYILIIVVVFILLRIAGKMLRYFMSPSNVGFWLLILGLLFIPHCAWISLAIIIGCYVVAPIIRHLPKDNKKDYSRKKGNGDGSTNWNTIIMLAIPIFWPFLILKLFVKDKTLPNDNSPFDYEQHEKSNRR
ncbi:hypothetical protein LDZ77_07410 [Bacteroides xylanisolvens]|uniref:DUF805 domain-containing protein n=1 Tax=Bacteroides xylanisolvens TaxID=371601 RepID=A0AAW4SXM3_9BACE|nr:hypothetical protein [Bacteroides xylanisolvens]MCA4532239.1 hypothetical protein [Bacteroides xylanisolvens]MCA4550419.1 hypothetical protein [Bacteroides xylanisolvens]MCA4563864.1 hypothetical protein [Bacteroides xylanisolvens]MCA4568491.1 hypothetical protein [Bacteroides xylanisolvens]MCA4599217.1 hypothetical protein [Bacteroides xylanisolvens]